MIKIIDNISAEPVQRHTFVYNDVSAEFVIRYSQQVEQWTFDCTIGSKSIFGAKLSVGTLHMVSRNMPIDFIVTDNTGSGIDPFKLNDFVSKRCSLYLVDDEGMAEIRGQEVEF